MMRFIVFIAMLDDKIYQIFMGIFCLLLPFVYMNTKVYIFIPLTIILVIFAFFRLVLTNNYKIKGKMFEKKIQFILEKKITKDKGYLANNCLFKFDNEYTQIDNILVTNKAIFIIEAKNYTGWVYGNESDIYWTQVIYKHKYNFFNPIKQNNKHIEIIKKILNLFEYIPVYNIIVFSNNATLKNINITSEKIHIVKDFRLYDEIEYIERKLNPVINDRAYLYITDLITKHNIIDKNIRDDYYREIKRKHINNC